MTVYDHFLDELEKISNSMMGYGGKNTAGASMSPPPSPTTGTRMSTPSMGLTTPSAAAPKISMSNSPGATSMKGMSVHCDKCFAEIKDQEPKFCPKCGNRIKGIRDIKTAPKDSVEQSQQSKSLEEEESEDEESGNDTSSSDSSSSNMGKYSAYQAAVSAAGDALAHPLMLKLKGGLALGGGGYAGLKAKNLIAGLQEEKPRYRRGPQGQLMKIGGVSHGKGSRMKAFNLHRRGGNYSSVKDGLARISKATSKYVRRYSALL